jgi:2'-5' RNA ligase
LILTFSQFLAEKYGSTGTYAALRFDEPSVERIAQYVKDNAIPNPLEANKLHVTLMYSRVECIGFKSPGKLPEPFIVRVKGFDVWKNGNGEGYALVVKLDAPEVVERHKQLMKQYKASYDFPEYQPHFTISYNVPDEFDTKTLAPFDGTLSLNFEFSEDLDTDWKAV